MPKAKKKKKVVMTRSGIYAPENLVKPSLLQKGLKKSAQEMNSTLDSIIKILSKDRYINEIELTLGFNAEGKFLGFGAGGDVSIKVKLSPESRTEMMARFLNKRGSLSVD